MNLKNILALSGIGVCLLALSGCASYRARPLARLATNIPQTSKKSVSFTYRAFNKADCKQYLDRDVIAKGYQPIHLTISNNTEHYYNFSLDHLSIPTVDWQDVAKCVHTSTAKRAASYGIGSLFLPVLIVPAVVDGVGSSQANQELDADFGYKSLQDQVINPFTTISGLIFVPRHNYTRDFTLALSDAQTHQRVVLSTAHMNVKA